MDVVALTETVELKPAPEPLLAIQALIDTRVILRGEERFTDPAATAAWLTATGLLASGSRVSKREFEQLIELREALREAIETRDAAVRRGDGSSGELAEIAARHPVTVGFDADGPTVDLSPARDVAELIAQLLGIALSASARGEWRRLKVCGAPDCRWAFYDHAKNRSGTWCSMEVCGNRAKARNHRARATRSSNG